MNKRKRVIVVGGGAAGMMAAVSAGRLGAEVTILEKNPRVGKKYRLPETGGATSLTSIPILHIITVKTHNSPGGR